MSTLKNNVSSGTRTTPPPNPVSSDLKPAISAPTQTSKVNSTILIQPPETRSLYQTRPYNCLPPIRKTPACLSRPRSSKLLACILQNVGKIIRNRRKTMLTYQNSGHTARCEVAFEVGFEVASACSWA